MTKAKTVVFGSYVADLTGRTARLPKPGETVKGSSFRMGPGGKGFNQGVAAHKAGADVAMMTKIGRDSFGAFAEQTMRELGMDASHLLYSETEPTGCALILVDEKTSQNEIVVIPGACGSITIEETHAAAAVLDGAGYLLMQLETNLDAMQEMVRLACEKGVRILLNPAPAQTVSEALMQKLWLVTPNETEAEVLTGIPVTDEASAERAAQWFLARGVKNALITLGSRGAYLHTEDGFAALIPAFSVPAIDTTGAGDAFNGGLLTALSEGRTLPEAARFASAVAALSVQKLGTAPSMPWREEVDAFLAAKKGADGNRMALTNEAGEDRTERAAQQAHADQPDASCCSVSKESAASDTCGAPGQESAL